VGTGSVSGRVSISADVVSAGILPPSAHETAEKASMMAIIKEMIFFI
jgi:hypothetical protein